MLEIGRVGYGQQVKAKLWGKAEKGRLNRLKKGRQKTDAMPALVEGFGCADFEDRRDHGCGWTKWSK